MPVLSKDLLCKPVVNKIIELVDHYMPKTERMRPGQVLWYAVDKEETAGYGKKIEDCQIVPVMLDLISEEDIEDIMNKLPKRKRQPKVAVRLHNQAYQQSGVLTYADTAAIMRLNSELNLCCTQHKMSSGKQQLCVTKSKVSRSTHRRW